MQRRDVVRGAGESVFLLWGRGCAGGRPTARRAAQGTEGAAFPKAPRSDQWEKMSKCPIATPTGFLRKPVLADPQFTFLSQVTLL